MNSFPKVLIINADPFNHINGSGITLSNLFDGWDKDKLAQVYLSDFEPSKDICTKFYKLKPQVAFIDYYIRKFINSFKKTNSIIATTPAAIVLNSEKNNIKSKFHLSARAIADYSPMILPNELFNWINIFKPDIIYSTLGSARMINLVIKIAEKIDRPVIPHFMDDWPKNLFTQNELFGIARKCFEKSLLRIFSKSNGGLCISEQMAEEFGKRYGISFEAFVNCVDDNLFSKPTMQSENTQFVIMYVGGLHLKRWESIIDISIAIEKLNKLSKDIILEIYCPEKDRHLYSNFFLEFKSTKFLGSLNSNDVHSVLKHANILLHIESFDENYVEYTKFSLSTKIPQYLAAGKPILGYGPGVLASIQHIDKAKAGRIIVEKKIEQLVFNLNEMIENRDLLINMATNGFNFARNFHSKSYNSLKLQRVITSCCK